MEPNAASVGSRVRSPGLSALPFPGSIPGDKRNISVGARYSKIVPKSSAPQIASAGWLVYTAIHSSSQLNINFMFGVTPLWRVHNVPSFSLSASYALSRINARPDIHMVTFYSVLDLE